VCYSFIYKTSSSELIFIVIGENIRSFESIAAIVAAEQPAFGKYQSYEQLRAFNFELQETYPNLARVELAGYSSDCTER